MSENTGGGKRYSRPRGFNIAGASAPVAPPFRRLWFTLTPASQPAQHVLTAPYRRLYSNTCVSNDAVRRTGSGALLRHAADVRCRAPER